MGSAGRHEAALPVLTADIGPTRHRPVGGEVLHEPAIATAGMRPCDRGPDRHASRRRTATASSAIEAGNTRVPATPVATHYPDAAAGDGTTQQGYNPLRWAEDWRGMRDPAKGDDVFDRLKYVPIGSDDPYLTLSGELHTRVNYFSSPLGRKSEHQRQDSHRIFVGADLHLGEHFRAYGELGRGPMDARTSVRRRARFRTRCWSSRPSSMDRTCCWRTATTTRCRPARPACIAESAVAKMTFTSTSRPKRD